MSEQPFKTRISGRAVLESHLDALVHLDPILAPIRQQAGEVPLRLSRSGFAGLAAIVSGQLLSVASAKAIHNRVETLVGEMNAIRFLEISESDLRSAGLSRTKIACLRGLAQAEIAGVLDYDLIQVLPLEKAMQALTRLQGIGRWSAEIYLMSAVGHPDVFPCGDLVLQKMVGKIQNTAKRPDEVATRKYTRNWSPYRGAAARLLWRYFAVLRQREGSVL